MQSSLCLDFFKVTILFVDEYLIINKLFVNLIVH